MSLIFRVFEAGLAIWFVALAAIVIGRVSRGDIDTTGLLRHGGGDAAVAPERVVSMLAFPVVLASYALSALHADVTATPALPDLSENMLLLLGGGNGLYLAGKIARS